ncbi:MAG: hypothetical protein MK135_01900 [Polyangiaceae bacterium]|nr:hypothetical protein [Polyangiaceae bacterium]
MNFGLSLKKAATRPQGSAALGLLCCLLGATLGCETGVIPDCPRREDFAADDEGQRQWRSASEANRCITPAGQGDAGCPGQDMSENDGVPVETQLDWQNRAAAAGCFSAGELTNCPGQQSYESQADWQARVCQLRCWPNPSVIETMGGCNLFCPGQQEGESIADWQSRASSANCFNSEAYEGGYCPGRYLDERLSEWQVRATDAGCAP